jgi:hypothetical protein
MGIRFGRRMANGTTEYHDSRESLAAAIQRDERASRASFFGLLGLLAGGVLTYIVLIKTGMHWPKWLRFALVIAGSGGASWVLHKFADLIWNVFVILAALAAACAVGALLWRLV